jgi:uncharacterized membrane protein YccF (DUF307 family)
MSDKVVIKPVQELPFIVRVIWFFAIGWYVAGFWILAAWFLNLTIVGLPFGLWMINRVPQILTLKARPGVYVDDGEHQTYVSGRSTPFPIRAVYFLLIGWWFSLVWATIGWLLCLTIIGLPLGVLMLNRLPAVTTLG